MKFPIVVLSGLLLAGHAWADVYKCVDPTGHVTYTNSKGMGKGCTLLAQDQAVSSVPGSGPVRSPGASAPQSGAPSSTTPGNFPRVEPSVQKARDNDRRGILEKEMATEQKALEIAQKELAEQEAIRNGDERNYQRVLDRLQPYKDKVQMHERNIEALRRELANLR
jgi:Domain of unknown function (DUF4124)